MIKQQQQQLFDWYRVNPEATECIAEELEEMGVNPYAQKWFSEILKLLNIKTGEESCSK